MKNAALSGKPYAGNPHVRFDEGEVASAKPRRGSLLYMTRCVLSAIALSLSLAAVAASDDAVRLAELNRKLNELETECIKTGRVLGEADAHGEYVLTEDGRRAEALRKEIAAICERNPEFANGNERSRWGLKPLGKPGTLKLPTEFVNKPAYAQPKPFSPGLVLFGNGKKCVIRVPLGNKCLRALADEFAYHLSKMTGEKFAVAENGGGVSDMPEVVFSESDEDLADIGHLKGEVSKVRRTGNRLLIAGRGSGASHATTYVLEALGCRYLWPGESGKVIPKRAEVVLPEDIDTAFTPKFVLRGVRDYGTLGDRIRYSLRRLGFDPDVAFARHRQVLVDHPGNRGFWQWHGVNDTRDVEGFSANPGAYAWGHYFGDYVKRYGKEHPEWFALQRDGTRDMSKVGERPTFCLSNRALAEETARDLVAKFKLRPDKIALSACLPDGGPTAQCMCPECRRLDPVNAPPVKFMQQPYVSRTDRVFTFANRVAEGVTAELPDKKLTFYAYCDYEDPPVAVRPNPALVLFVVTGEYTIGRYRDIFTRVLAGWSSFGNEMFWRPNVLRGYHIEVPQDFSRRAFEDTELCKANNFIGTDFDCMDNKWAVKGLTYYMTAKALMNPRRLDYDAHLDDYCRAGFGSAAADIRDYFGYLAKVSETVAEANDEYRGGAEKYLRALDLDAANGFLDNAERSAKGDAAVLRRIRFLRVGMEYARHNKRCMESFRLGDRQITLARQREFLKYLHDSYADDDALVAVSVCDTGFYNSNIRGALNELEKNPPKGGLTERISAVNDGRSRTLEVFAALDRLRLGGGGVLEFEKGDYRFDASAAVPLRFFISNHDQSDSHPVLFPIVGMTSVTIRANGARFLTDGPAIPFYIRDSKNVSIEGVEMDAVHPVMTEARIEGFAGGKTVVRTTGNGRCTPVGSAMVFDGRNGGIIPQSGDIPYKGAMRELSDGRLELAYDFSRVGTGAKVGDIVVLRPPNRPTPAIVIENSADTVLTDVVVHDAHGMALVAQHSENVTWRGTGSAADRRSGVFPSKGRVSSTHADATHFSNVKGRVCVENCLFEGMMDDAINVHSTSLAITKVLTPNRILCQFKHFQAYGFDVFLPGEKVRFISGATLENGPVLTVCGVSRPRVNEVELTLDGPIPAGYAVGDAVENADYQPSVSFVGNIVRNNRARAALFTTSRPVVCASNLFARVSGSAVLLAGDAQKWYESGACTDVAVFGNVFSNCCASAKCHGYCKGVISVCPTVGKIDEQKARYHRNLRITDNTFYTFDVPLLYACSAENVVFKDNRIRRNDDFAGWKQPVFVIERCANVKTEE